MIRPGIRRLFRLPLRGRDRLERELEDEIRLHIELRAEQLVEGGLAPERARAEALHRFGPIDEARRGLWEAAQRREDRMRAREWLETLLQDVRYGGRLLRRNPGFAAVAVLTLALGIGSTTAIFTVVNGVLLRSLPYENAERLVILHTVIAGEGRSDRLLSPPNFASLREEGRTFADVVAFLPSDAAVTGVGEARTVESARVSAGFFEVFGLRPILGRTFRPEENEPGSTGVVVLGAGLWRQLSGEDPGVVGRTLRLDGMPHTIVGVMPEGFDFPGGGALWVPQEYGSRWSATTDDGRKSNTWVPVLARIRPGVSLEEARSELRTLSRRLRSAFPESNAGVSFTAVRLRDEVVGEVRAPLLLLLGAVGPVLLIACANVAGLLLARTVSRSEEVAVRAALGAGRGRLLRQLVTESLVLGVAGGVLGLLLAVGATQALVAAAPEGLPRLQDIRLDGAVLGFALAVTLLAGALAGLLPALRVTEGGLARSIRAGGRSEAGPRAGQRFRGGLVVLQLALAVILLAGAGLLLRSFARLTSTDPGFRTEQILAFRAELPVAEYDSDEEIRVFFGQLSERLGGLAGVESVGMVYRLPIAQGHLRSRFQVEGRPPPGPGDLGPRIGVQSVTPEYFRALGIPVVRGRGLTEQDRAGATPVAVINEAAAERFFAGQDPIGQRVGRFSYDPVEERAEWFTVVGVVGDVRSQSLSRAAEAEVYFPHAQIPFERMWVAVRSAADPLALAGGFRSELAELEPNLPAPEFQTLDTVVAESVSRPRFLATLVALFALLALVLAAIGIFGLLSFTVAQQTREIGVRIALGAPPGGVLQMVVHRALLLAGIGLSLGVIGAPALTRLLRSQLYEVSPSDPATFAGVVLVLGATTVVASLIPARRAASVDPMQALRHQ